MSIESWIENEITAIEGFAVKTEQEALDIAARIHQGVQVLEAEAQALLKWIADETPAIEAFVGKLLSIAQVVSAADPALAPEVAGVTITANTAMAALTAFSQSYESGTGGAQAAFDAYQVYTKTKAATSAAAAALVSTPAVKGPAPAAPAAA